MSNDETSSTPIDQKYLYTLTYEDILNDWQLSFNYVSRNDIEKCPHTKLYREACKKWNFYQ